MAWLGGVLYVLAVGLLIGGGPRASGTVHGIGALLAASLLVGVLRRRPILALAMMLLGSTAVVVGSPGSAEVDLSASYQGQFLPYLAVDLVLGFIVATRARRTSTVAVATSLVVQVLLVGGFAHGDSLTVNLVIALLAMAAACTVGLLSRERREHAVELRAQEVAEAVVAERLQIARELHDMVAHSIGIIAIQAGVGSRVIQTQPEEAREALRAIEATSRETLSGLRRTLVALRQADPDAAASGRAPLTPSPGLADIERLATATADAGVRVDVRRDGEQRPLPADIDLSAYRIVQEALTNVVRHAGTGHCRVSIEYGDGELSVEIVDDGRGAAEDGPAHGFGIVGMRERVALLHGRLNVGPRPEGGFRVAARLPLPGPAGALVEAR
ncbi:sensor histidine kinase [Streptomyces antarcticus]|uniref:sensor histidine kinase n=1 Tax=Streptomyces antarcticus TaxID=2996458 RepID=UPI002270089A|nr:MULTISPECIES: sensor histidine kinase [unclassified Streptomyces]MCY0944958.1 sensor histidine kinase [Streptomyces sp. H34-AA3]MCZ4082130.1 sensor histidine kinase [Streptomyces sp. H34-S5]